MYYSNIPNRAKETGVFDGGDVVLDDTTALDNCLLFSVAFDGNAATLTVLIESQADPNVWAIYGATYDGIDTLICDLSTGTVNKGTLSGPLAVNVSAVFSDQALRNIVKSPSASGVLVLSGTDEVLTEADIGKLVVCTNTDAMTLSLPDLPLTQFDGYYNIIRAGAGSVAITPGTADTINGSGSALSMATQYKLAYMVTYGSTEEWLGII